MELLTGLKDIKANKKGKKPSKIWTFFILCSSYFCYFFKILLWAQTLRWHSHIAKWCIQVDKDILLFVNRDEYIKHIFSLSTLHNDWRPYMMLRTYMNNLQNTLDVIPLIAQKEFFIIIVYFKISPKWLELRFLKKILKS